jgi:hypothetical protein
MQHLRRQRECECTCQRRRRRQRRQRRQRWRRARRRFTSNASASRRSFSRRWMSSFTDGSMNIMMSTMLLLCSQKSGVSRFNQAQKIRPGRAEVLAARSQRARVLPQLTRGARCCAPGCPEQQLSGVADSVGRLSRLLSRCVVRSLQHLVCLRQLASGTSRNASVSAQGCRLFAQAVAGCAV